MREIKFRAWTGATMEYNVIVGKFGAFYVNPGSKGDGLDEKDTASLTPFNTKYSQQIPIMQFTGLKDKNGKEIYEGDIVRHTYDPVGDREVPYEKIDIEQIAYANDCFGFKRGDDVIRLGDCMFFKDGIAADLEVIGNIYENPELLTQSFT